MHLQGEWEGRNAEGEFCAVADYDQTGQTIRDMNKTHKTDPPKLGSLYPMSTFSTSGRWRHLSEVENVPIG